MHATFGRRLAPGASQRGEPARLDADIVVHEADDGMPCLAERTVAGGGEPAPRLGDEPPARQLGQEGLGRRSRLIRGAVVDDEQLVFRPQLRSRSRRARRAGAPAGPAWERRR